jgi:transposase-like protein
MSEKAKQRAEVILKVQRGEMTTAAGAAALGVSRKTFYEWQERALVGLAMALEDLPAGRPETPVDLEKEALVTRNQELERELEVAKQTVEVKRVLLAWQKQKDKESGKKNQS